MAEHNELGAWGEDEGGGGVCEYADDMYENGNKIGYFG